MRVLICAVELPVPPLNGFRLQLRHLVGELAGRHDLHVVAFGTQEEAAAMPAGVGVTVLPRPSARRTRLAAAGYAFANRLPRRSILLGRPMSAAVRRLLADRDFDVAHVSGPGLAGVASALGSVPAVLSTLDAWHLNAAADVRLAGPLMRPLMALEERNVRRFGATAYRPYERLVVVSEADAVALRELDAKLEVEVIPNGVDFDLLAPNPSTSRDPRLVVFTGAMSWSPNVEAASYLAREILPALRRRVPDARVAIVGRNPSREVQALAALDGVEVTGEVDDIRSWLWRAGAFACSMVSGTGIKNKLLEALACGAPAVVTRLSCQGLEVEVGRDLLVATDTERFAAELARVLTDPELSARLGANGRAAMVAAHGWGRVAEAYERIYSELTRRPHASV